MRPLRRLTALLLPLTALVAVCAFGLLTPAAVAASSQATTLTAAPSTYKALPYGASVIIHASITASDTPLAGRQDLYLWHRTSSRASWKRGAGLVYDKVARRYTATLIVRQSLDAQVRFAGSATLAPSRSAIMRVRCADPFWENRYRGKRVTHIHVKQKLVALTFDDGPTGRVPAIIKTLKKYGAKSTFFVCAEGVKNNPKAFKAIEANGMEIANHTWGHEPLAWHSLSADLSQIRRLDSLLAKKHTTRPIWVRAMGGSIDRTGMTAVARTNHLYVNWSVDSYDSHQRYLPPEIVYHNVVSMVHPGSIVLLHMTHPESAQALPRICATLKARGYKMITLSEMAARGKP